MIRSVTLLCVVLLAGAHFVPAAAYVSCEHMHQVAMQSDCVVTAVLVQAEREPCGNRIRGGGVLVVESAAFGAAPGDSLHLTWEYDAPVIDGKWGYIKSPADPDYEDREGVLSLWFLRFDEGVHQTTSMHCSVWSFGSGIDRVIGYLSGPPVIPKSAVLEWSVDGWKPGTVSGYLLSLKPKE